jgi:hypothetical protein
MIAVMDVDASTHHSRSESTLFAPSMVLPRFGYRRAPRVASKVALAVAQFALIVGLAVAGTVFLGLTIASPIVVPLADRQGVVLSAADLATAQQVGSGWWIFAIGMVASFGAALATLGNLMQRLAGSTGE